MRCTFHCFSLFVVSLKYQQSFCVLQWEFNLVLHIYSHLKNVIQIALHGAFMLIKQGSINHQLILIKKNLSFLTVDLHL